MMCVRKNKMSFRKNKISIRKNKTPISNTTCKTKHIKIQSDMQIIITILSIRYANKHYYAYYLGVVKYVN